MKKKIRKMLDQFRFEDFVQEQLDILEGEWAKGVKPSNQALLDAMVAELKKQFEASEPKKTTRLAR